MTLNCLRIIFRKMSTSRVRVLMPINVRGMKVLDREKFLRNLEIPILKATAKNVGVISSLCKSFYIKLDQFKPVCNLEAEDDTFDKYICLNPDKISKWTDFKEEDRLKMKQHNVDERNFCKKEIQITYNNWKYEDIFKAVLPEDAESVSGFSQIGHIVHLNLRECLMEYRYLIGEVLLDKIKTCRTVINKSNTIDNIYRNFDMEVLAGDEVFVVTTKENNMTFQFDYSQVYWNPRLGKEHARIINYLKPGDIFFDIFCGVGPFALPALKRKCAIVFANDLNPDAYKWLNHNERNIKHQSDFRSYNRDGKYFIKHIFKEYITNLCNGMENITDNAKIHITMNLPGLAVTFLKYFRGLITEDMAKQLKNEIVVYVYCFVTGGNYIPAAKQLVIANMGCDISNQILDVFDVRNVSPYKEMMRVTIRLTGELLSDPNVSEIDEPPNKKLCVEPIE